MDEALHRLRNRVLVLGLAGIVVGACGPKATNVETSTPVYSSKDSMIKGGNFAVPENADSPMASKKLNLMFGINVDFPKMDNQETRSGSLEDQVAVATDRIEPEVADRLEAVFESMLPELKRFTIFALRNTAGEDAEERFVEGGRIAARDTLGDLSEAPEVSLNVLVQVRVAVERFSGQGGSDAKITYRMVPSVTLSESATRRIIASETLGQTVATRNVSAQYERGGGGREKIIGGFDPGDSKTVGSMLENDADLVLRELVTFLGRYYPVTGSITAVRSQGGVITMAMNKGREDGVTNDTQVCVWVDDGGIPTAIANGNCEALAGSSKINAYAWNTKDPAARALIDRIQNESNIAESMKIYATTIGLPFPKR